MEESI